MNKTGATLGDEQAATSSSATATPTTGDGLLTALRILEIIARAETAG